MSNNRTNGITGLTRGGQIIHHYLLMLFEVATKIFSVAFFFSFIVFVVMIFWLTSKQEFISAANYFQAWYVIDLTNSTGNVFYFTDWLKWDYRSASAVYNHETIQLYSRNFKSYLYISLLISSCIFGLFYLVAFIYLIKKGKSLNDETNLRGSTLITGEQASEIINSQKNKYPIGSLMIGEIPLPKAMEPQSFLIIGAPGSGKSVITSKWIANLRKEKRKAFILDRSGGFIEKFYDPSKDIIINPYDTRTAHWSIFKECKADYHYTFVANTLIKKTDKDVPFWPLAAQLVFKSLLMKEAVQDNPSMSSLMHNIMRCSLDEMVNACKGTDAASVFDSEGMKMAASIRSVISSEVQILRVMDTDKGDFSVRDWVNNESEGFIFVSTLKDQEEALRPFITLLCDIFMNSVMTLKPDFNRRIWILLDEAQALGNLKSLPSYLAESRKYGGCCMAGFQGYSQAKRIYGDEGVEELSDLFATFIVMACNGNKTAEWSAKQLGKSDNIEVNESLSYGLNSARDGANLQNTRRERDVVMPSQLQNLDDLEGYVRLGKGIPVASFSEVYVDRKSVAEAFIIDEEIINRQMNDLRKGADESKSTHDSKSSNRGEDVDSSLHNSANQLNEFFVPGDDDASTVVSDLNELSSINNSDSNNAFEIVDTFSDDYEMGR